MGCGVCSGGCEVLSVLCCLGEVWWHFCDVGGCLWGVGIMLEFQVCVLCFLVCCF